MLHVRKCIYLVWIKWWRSSRVNLATIKNLLPTGQFEKCVHHAGEAQPRPERMECSDFQSTDSAMGWHVQRREVIKTPALLKLYIIVLHTTCMMERMILNAHQVLRLSCMHVAYLNYVMAVHCSWRLGILWATSALSYHDMGLSCHWNVGLHFGMLWSKSTWRGRSTWRRWKYFSDLVWALYSNHCMVFWPPWMKEFVSCLASVAWDILSSSLFFLCMSMFVLRCWMIPLAAFVSSCVL